MSIITMFFLVFLSFFLQGCPIWEYLEPPAREPVAPQGELSEARELVYSFLHARIAGESADDLQAYLTSEAGNDYEGADLLLQSTGSPGFVGYRVEDESKLTGGKFGFTVVMQEIIQDPLQTENTVEDLVVSFDKEEYRISSARALAKSRAWVEDGVLQWMRMENGAGKEPSRLITLEDLPAETARADPAQDGEKIGIEAFSTVILSPADRSAAFGTLGDNGLVAVLNWEEQGPAAGTTLLPVELLPGEAAALMLFSPDARYLAVNVQGREENRRILVYQTAEGNRAAFDLGQDFPPELYNTVLKRWEPDSRRFLVQVNPRWETAEIDQEKPGIWSVRVPAGEKEKLLGR